MGFGSAIPSREATVDAFSAFNPRLSSPPGGVRAVWVRQPYARASVLASKVSREKNLVFQRMFKLPSNEVLVDDYSCAYLNKILLQGRMYLSENYVCFYSKVFAYETKLKIPVSDILGIQKKTTAIVFANAIELKTSEKEYFFGSFLTRDHAFDNMQKSLDAYRQSQRDSAGLPESLRSVPAVERDGGTDAKTAAASEPTRSPPPQNAKPDQASPTDTGMSSDTGDEAVPPISRRKRSLSDPSRVSPSVSVNNNSQYAAKRQGDEQNGAASAAASMATGDGSDPRVERKDSKAKSMAAVGDAVNALSMPDRPRSTEVTPSFDKGNKKQKSSLTPSPLAPARRTSLKGSSETPPAKTDSKKARKTLSRTPPPPGAKDRSSDADRRRSQRAATSIGNASKEKKRRSDGTKARSQSVQHTSSGPFPDSKQQPTTKAPPNIPDSDVWSDPAPAPLAWSPAADPAATYTRSGTTRFPFDSRTFWRLFWDDSAPLNLPFFHTHIEKDEKYKINRWHGPGALSTRAAVMQRHAFFMKVGLSGPIGPKETRVHQVQRVRLLDDAVVLDTHALSPDVPRGTYFYCKLRWVVVNTGADGRIPAKYRNLCPTQDAVPPGGAGCILQVWTSIVFLKQTWLASTIRPLSRNGCEGSVRNWIKWARKETAGGVDALPDLPDGFGIEEPPTAQAPPEKQVIAPPAPTVVAPKPPAEAVVVQQEPRGSLGVVVVAILLILTLYYIVKLNAKYARLEALVREIRDELARQK